MPTVTSYKAISGNALKNNGGTVINAGNIASNSRVTKTFSLKTFYDGNRREYGSKVAYRPSSGHMNNVVAGISGRSFGTMTKNRYICMRLPTWVAGTSTDTLLKGSNGFPHRSINFKTRRRTVRTSSAGINLLTGRYVNTPAYGIDYFGNSASAPGRDDAAQPTRAIPGEFTYTSVMSKTSSATQADYRAKTE